eukprot:comp19860_c0_seq1/m.23982 comp19860_c0_seq1/g.23982  ORF comp19860_c0_seq1/g.23982 comp19860_c0_seq1/m.23982 type:complete len:513 (-) comp19860_c0_seq1:316-1854(-)
MADGEVAFDSGVDYVLDAGGKRKHAFIFRATENLWKALEEASKKDVNITVQFPHLQSKGEQGKIIFGENDDHEFEEQQSKGNVPLTGSNVTEVARVDRKGRQVSVIALVRNKLVIKQKLNKAQINRIHQSTIEAETEKNSFVTQQTEAVPEQEIVMKTSMPKRGGRAARPVGRGAGSLARPGPPAGLQGRTSPAPGAGSANLRNRAVHLLAPRNQSFQALEKTLRCTTDETRSNLQTILALIATQHMGEFELKPQSYKEVQVHTWGAYDARERELVLERMKQAFDKLGLSEADRQQYLEKKDIPQQQAPAPISRVPEPLIDPAVQLPVPKMRDLKNFGKKPAAKKTKAAAGGKKGAKQGAKSQEEGDGPKPPPGKKQKVGPGRGEDAGNWAGSRKNSPPGGWGRSSPSDPYPSITNASQYQHYYKEFQDNYPRYLELAERLKKNNDETLEIQDRIKHYPEKSKEYLDLKAKLQARYRSVYKDLQSWLEEYNQLHDKLSAIKTQIHNYNLQNE